MTTKQTTDKVSPSLVKLSLRKLRKVLDRYFPYPDASIFLWSASGIGKSLFLKDFAKDKAKELGLRFSEDPKDINDPSCFMFIVLPAAQLDSAELKGLVYPNDDRTEAIYLPLGRILPTAGQGLIFLDEFNQGYSSVQKNFFQILDKVKTLSLNIPEGYRIYAAGNRIEDNADINDVNGPLLNRFFHYELVTTDPQEWAEDWAYKNGVDQRIIGFNLAYRDKLHRFDPTIDGLKAYATPRIWAKVSKIIQDITDPEELADIVGGAIGEVDGSFFAEWVKLSEKFDIEKIYKERKFEVPDRIDVRFSLLSAIIAFYKSKAFTPGITIEAKGKMQEAYCEIALSFPEKTMKEFRIFMLKNLKVLELGMGTAEKQVYAPIKAVNPALYKQVILEASEILLA